MKSENPEEIAVIGVDIGKDRFHLVGFDQTGQRVLGRRLSRTSQNQMH